MKTLITPDQARRARRAIGITQARLAEETGVNLTLIKHFETYRISTLPEAAQKALVDYFTKNGLDIGHLQPEPADDAASKPGAGVVQPVPRAAVLPSRFGFLVSDKLSDDEIEELLERMDQNDERIEEIVAMEAGKGFLGSYTDDTIALTQELFGAMAENYLIFRHLQGRNLFEKIDLDADAETHGHLVHGSFVNSPIASKLAPSPKPQQRADNPTEA